MISRSVLAQAIAENTMYQADAGKLKLSIAAYLLEQNRAEDVESLMRDVLKYRAEHGYVEATVVSAYPLSSQVEQDLMNELKKAYPGGKSYLLNQRLDPDVVGGVRLEMATEELDLTVRAKLNRFKRLTKGKE